MSQKNRTHITIQGNGNRVTVSQKNRRGWFLQLFLGSGKNEELERKHELLSTPCSNCNGAGCTECRQTGSAALQLENQ